MVVHGGQIPSDGTGHRLGGLRFVVALPLGILVILGAENSRIVHTIDGWVAHVWMALLDLLVVLIQKSAILSISLVLMKAIGFIHFGELFWKTTTTLSWDLCSSPCILSITMVVPRAIVVAGSIVIAFHPLLGVTSALRLSSSGAIVASTSAVLMHIDALSLYV